MSELLTQLELIEPVDIADLTVIGQAEMRLEKDEWDDYLDVINCERRGLRPPLSEEEIDDLADVLMQQAMDAFGLPQNNGDNYILPLHNCPACKNKLDANEHCKTCDFDIYPAFGNPGVNWAEAFAEF